MFRAGSAKRKRLPGSGSAMSGALTFRRETREDLRVIEAGPDDLESHAAIDRLGLFGEIDHTHAALAERIEDLVRTDPFEGGIGGIERKAEKAVGARTSRGGEGAATDGATRFAH